VTILCLRSGTGAWRERELLAEELSRARRGRAVEALAARYLEKLSGVWGVRLESMMDCYVVDVWLTELYRKSKKGKR
jgi:hypothetical protein